MAYLMKRFVSLKKRILVSFFFFFLIKFIFQWYIQATCAVQGQGLYEGLDWLSNELSKK